MKASRSLYPSARKFTASLFAVSIGLLISACGTSSPPANLADSSANALGPGLVPGASSGAVDPSMVQAGGAPALTGTGVPTSLAQAQAAGLNPGQLPANFDYNSLINAWAQQWQNKLSPFNPSNLPSGLQQILQSFFCSTYQNYGTNNNQVYALIMGYYVDILHRFGSYSEVQGWMQQTSVYSQSSRQNTALQFINSDEANTNFINRAYYGFLRRAPSASDTAAWLNAIKSGQAAELEDMYSTFAGSPEYFSGSYGGKGNVSTWIAALYRDILGRVAAPWEITAWQNQYNANGGNMILIAKGFEYSDENYLKFITNSYLFFLNRFPSGSELQTGLAQMRAGTHMRLFMAQLMGTSNYLQLQPPRFNSFMNPNSCN